MQVPTSIPATRSTPSTGAFPDQHEDPPSLRRMSLRSPSHRISHRHGDTGPFSAAPRWLLIAALIPLLLVLPGAVADADAASSSWRCSQHRTITPHQAIDCVWPAASRAAAHRVAECESTASASESLARRESLGRWARNGKYVGIFQMGPSERGAHGWYRRGASALVQVRSALSLYEDRGWGPWSCA